MKAELFNKYPAGMREQALKDFQKPITFKLCNVKEDPDNKGRFLLPTHKNVPCRDIILDNEGNPLHIAYIIGTSITGEAQLGDIVYGRFNQGQITLNPKNPKDREKFIFMYFTNYNLNAPQRSIDGYDTDVEPIFYTVNPAKEARERRQKREQLKKAMKAVEGLKSAAIDEVYTILSGVSAARAGDDEKLDYVENLAQTNPGKLLTVVENKHKEIEAIIKEAVSQKVLRHDNMEGKFVLTENGKEVFSYTKEFGTKAYEKITEFVVNSPETLKAITTLLNLKNTAS